MSPLQNPGTLGVHSVRRKSKPSAFSSPPPTSSPLPTPPHSATGNLTRAQMEALCFTPYVKIPTNGVILQNVNTTRRRRPSVSATMSKSKADIDLLTKEARSTTAVLRTREQPPPLLRVSPSSLQYESGLLGAVPDHKVEEGNGALSEMEYLTNILSSNRVYDVAIESPLSLAPKLSERLGVNIWLKREDLQPVSTHLNTISHIFQFKLVKINFHKHFLFMLFICSY